MSHIETLKKLLEEDVLPEIEDAIDDLFELVADKKETDEDREELEELREVYKEFQDLLADVEDGDITEEEAEDLIVEINEMRSGNSEDE